MSFTFSSLPRPFDGKAPGRRRFVAFTLLELIVVIVVLSLLALIAVPTFQSVLDRSNLQAQLTRDEAVARDVQAILAFRDGTTAVDALTIALSELPAASAGVLRGSQPVADGVPEDVRLHFN